METKSFEAPQNQQRAAQLGLLVNQALFCKGNQRELAIAQEAAEKYAIQQEDVQQLTNTAQAYIQTF